MYRKVSCLMVGFILTLLLIRDASATLEGTTWEGYAEGKIFFFLSGVEYGTNGTLEFETDGTFEIYLEGDSTSHGGEYVEWECGETDTCFIASGSQVLYEGPDDFSDDPARWSTLSQKFAGFGRVAGQNMDAFALVSVRAQTASLDDPNVIFFGLSVPITVYLDSVTQATSSLGR